MTGNDYDRPNLSPRTEEDKKLYNKLCQSRQNALRNDNGSHYWNNFTICWGKKANKQEGWLIKCNVFKEKISANNVADSAPQHMKSRKICLGSYDLWLKHKAQHGAKKRKQPSDAEMHVFDHMNSQGRNCSITEYRFDRSALMKFLECFKTWILYNNTSISFRCIEDEKLREGLAALGFPHGICRKALCTTFLDTKYQEFLTTRAQRLNSFKCFQIAGDSWKSKYVNESNKLVGMTLNFPDGCYLGDIFPTELGDTVSASYLLTKMTRLIDGLGSEYYIGCVFDGESAYQSAGRQLGEKYPGSVHLTCQAHTLSLLLKQIEKVEPDCFRISHALVKLCNEKDCKSVLHTFQKAAYGKTNRIRIGVETRFGYFVTEMEDLLDSKESIRNMAGNQSLRSKYNLTSSRATESQKTDFSSIDSDEFWGNLETLVKHLGPLVEIIEHIEQDKPMITQMFFVSRFLAYHFRVSELPIEDDYGGRIINRPMIETDLETQPLSEKEKAIANAVRVRMSNTSTDIFALAFLLDLRFYIQTGYNRFIPPLEKVGLKDIDLAKVALKALAPPEDQKEALIEFDMLMKQADATKLRRTGGRLSKSARTFARP